jgi:hypothetical protein
MALTKLPKNAIGTGAVDASKIEDGTIQNAELAGSLTGTQLASTLDLSSKTITLPNTSVTSDQLVNSTIANAKLSNSTITVRGTSRALGDSFSIGVDVDWQSVIIADGSTGTTGSAGRGYFIDTTSAAHTFTLPASATRGDTIGILDYAGTFATNKLTIARNGHNIQGVANNSLIGTNRASLILVYADVTKGWLFAEENNVADLQALGFISATGGTVTESGDFKIHTFTGDGCFVVSTAGLGPTAYTDVDYLVVAGGGGGSWAAAGGAGAGGVRFSAYGPPLNSGTGVAVSITTYPITVGAGGSSGSGPGGGATCATNGSNSIFSTITSAGGGASNATGGSGGGRGGFSSQPTTVSGNTPPVSPPQGNPGGSSPGAPGIEAAAGSGGGAGAAGNPGAGPNAGTGANGVTVSISGSSVYYGGGGGTGGDFRGYGAVSGPGGLGGGGTGGGQTGSGSPGSANTGGGGGGGSYYGGNFVSGGSGGKGIVLIRYKFQ